MRAPADAEELHAPFFVSNEIADAVLHRFVQYKRLIFIVKRNPHPAGDRQFRAGYQAWEIRQAECVDI